MKFPTRYFVAAALVAAPVSLAAQTAPPAAAQGEHAREGARGERGQGRGERGVRGPRGARGGSPVARLIAQRQRLGLTDAQVQRLQAIDRDLQARNAPLQQQLQGLFPERAQRAQGDRAQPQGERQARPDRAQRAERRQRGERPQRTEAQRQQMQQRRVQAEPLVQQIRQNGQAALTQARGVLTAEQQAQVQRLFEARGERGEGRRGLQGEGRRGERGERPRAGTGATR